MEDEKKAGSCLCGAVRYQMTGAFAGFFLCHCARCRKDTGSAYAANLFAPGAMIDWLAGKDGVTTFRLTGTRHQRAFCSACGSALPSATETGAIVVPAGSLDTPVDRRPDAHICFASRAEWDEHLEDAPKLDGLPG